MFDKKENAALVPLPLDGIGAAGPDGAAAPLLFRGQSISWATTQQTRQVAEENAFGPDHISESPGRRQHFILYGGQPYTREDFYRAVF